MKKIRNMLLVLVLGLMFVGDAGAMQQRHQGNKSGQKRGIEAMHKKNDDETWRIIRETERLLEQDIQDFEQQIQQLEEENKQLKLKKQAQDKFQEKKK